MVELDTHLETLVVYKTLSEEGDHRSKAWLLHLATLWLVYSFNYCNTDRELGAFL
jgi:hypothetical protein